MSKDTALDENEALTSYTAESMLSLSHIQGEKA